MKPVLVALAVTLAVQSLASIAMIAPSVLAPVAARDLGVAPQSIGIFASLTYLGAMFSGLSVGALVARRGALAVCQIALVIAAIGLTAGCLGAVAVVPLAAILIGVAYGFVNPVGSHILARRTPPGMMALVFSIKQTGVPLGGAIAGAVVPGLLLAFDWRTALGAIAAVCVASVFAILPARRTLADAPADGEAPAARAPLAFEWRRAIAGMTGPVRLALAHPRLRDLAFVSFGYAAVQIVFITYVVSYLNLGLGHTLVTAGLVYAFAHGAGVVGRITWGAIADRWLAPRATLALLGALAALCGALTASASDAWPIAGIAAIAILFGASAVGWNGVYLAEVARSAPAGQVGTATGGTQFFTFFGALLGPPLFAAIVWATASYAWGFAFFALVSATVAARLLAARPAGRG
jgi:MFS family permease